MQFAILRTCISSSTKDANMIKDAMLWQGNLDESWRLSILSTVSCSQSEIETFLANDTKMAAMWEPMPTTENWETKLMAMCGSETISSLFFSKWILAFAVDSDCSEFNASTKHFSQPVAVVVYGNTSVVAATVSTLAQTTREAFAWSISEAHSQAQQNARIKVYQFNTLIAVAVLIVLVEEAFQWRCLDVNYFISNYMYWVLCV